MEVLGPLGMRAEELPSLGGQNPDVFEVIVLCIFLKG